MDKELKTQDLNIKIIDALENADNIDDYENGTLEKAMDYFCSSYDKGYGMKQAIRATLTDQYNNHKEDLTIEELEKLLAILKNK